MEENPNIKLYFSLISGEIYGVLPEEEKVLDKYQVPLLKPPKPTCKKCHGRGYPYKNISLGIYPICNCLRRHIDFSRVKEEEFNMETLKVDPT
jgi:hypothetical protein